jgi:hypothetical protein
MQMAHEKQECEMTQIRKIIAMLVDGNANRDNAPNNIPNTTSPPVMPKSSVGGGVGDLHYFSFVSVLGIAEIKCHVT